ncbi:MAG: hypothetical protein CO170_04460 [candidate division SR1 bacterium CG_4_9_14_3_um_filter_40_9]|nr:MAG: hypothetical protein CO170_04460 [candidate division SR1 bacterium CG_4_9_14_3_um_filter_40_9]
MDHFMINFLKKNKISLFIVTIFLTIYGISAVFTIPKEATPSANIPYYIVSVVYAGADPATIEEQVVNKLEQRFKSISLIKNVKSTSSANMGIISLEFYPNKKDVDATNDIKAAIDQVYPTLPSDVKVPTLKKVDISNTPIYTFSVAAHYPTEMIYDKVKALEDKIKSTPGVGEVTVIGKPTKEIKINFDADKIAALDLDISMVVAQLKGAFVKMPADKKEVSDKLFSFEITNYENNLTGFIEQIKNYDIVSKDGKSIKVEDIAEVVLSYKGGDKSSYIFTDRQKKASVPRESMNALSFQVTKVPGYSIETLTKDLKSQVADFSKLNPEFQFMETTSMLELINKVYNLFIENFRGTGLLVLIIIFFFLGMRSSMVILISFLIVYLADFGFLKSIGYSFNNIVSFSLILVLGVMIDNLIVIMQGIVMGLRKHKNDIWLAIEDALKNYAKPIIFGTSTTIAIFVPLYFGLSGIMGEFMKPMPVTIISNLAISLLVTLIILPILTTFVYRPGMNYRIRKSLQYLEDTGKKFAQRFGRISATRAGAAKVVVFFIAFFIGAVSLIPLGIVKVDFMGNIDSNNVRINVKYAPGITIQENQKYTSQISNDILDYINSKYPQVVKDISVDLGSQNGGSMLSAGGGATNNLASFNIRLIEGESRTLKSYQIVEDLQQFFSTNIKKKYSFIQDIAPLTQKASPSAGKAVGFYIEGKEYTQINDYIQKILPSVKKIPGIYNVNASIEYTNGKIKYILDENLIKSLGISNMSAILAMVSVQNSDYEPNGVKIKDFSEFGDDSLPLIAFLQTKGNLDNFKIGKVYMSQIIKEKRIEPELKGISKLDGEKVILIEADKIESVALSDVTKQIDAIIKANPLPQGLSYKAAGDVQSQAASAQDLGIAMLIGLILMYMILIIQFNNVRYATVIITSIFISIGGSISLLALLGLKFTFVAQLGIFGVLGVGVNQALIHIEDFKEYYEKRGFSVLESFKMSIAERFIPIFLTKAVTITGLLILAFKDEMFGSMAVAFIGGLIVSFFITLLFIPSLMRLISREYFHKEKKGEAMAVETDDEIDEVFRPIQEAPETINQ